MPRARLPGRLSQILDAGALVFIAKGYRLARVEDIARKAGVAPATVHLYAATKEALFDLVMRCALHDPTVLEVALPYRAPPTTEFVERTWQRLLSTADFPVLRALGAAAPREGAEAELRSLVREGYRWLLRHHRAITLIERAAPEWPELAKLFSLQFRRDFLQRLTAHLERRAAQGLLRTTPDAAIAARVILETISYFGVHRHSAHDGELDDARTEEAVLDLIAAALRLR